MQLPNASAIGKAAVMTAVSLVLINPAVQYLPVPQTVKALLKGN